MTYRDETGNRVWSAALFVIAAVTLIIAFGAFPTSEKGVVGWIIAIGLMLIAVAALVGFFTGKSIVGSKELRRPRMQRIASIALIVLAPILIVSTIITSGNGEWSAYAVLSIGLWASLFVIGLAALPIANAQLRKSEG